MNRGVQSARLLLWLVVFLPALPAFAQKVQIWTEVRSPNFIVVTDAGEKQGRRVAEQFEQFRDTFRRALPRARVDMGKPLIILATKNEKGLRELLPEYWERKGGVRPAGVFLSGDEKLYVALRTDVYGESPYGIIYHEYVHALVDLNFETIPLWLNEGLAEFYANTVLASKQVGLGRPDTNSILLLQQEKLLPFEVLFAADHDSPHYNERNRASIFYAQSWALVHYLTFADWKAENPRLSQYMAHLLNKVEPVEAARQAFGDLKALEKQLSSYVRRGEFSYLKGKASGDIDEKSFPMRALTQAESAAVRGDFHARRNRSAEARALLEEALRLEPANAQAHESLGVLELRQNNMDAAMVWFDKAAQLDSRSYLTQYFAAMLTVRKGLGSGHTSAAEARLLRAIELNPQFAPAHSTLANLYQFRDETLAQALHHAKRAAELEPGEQMHRINVGNVLLRMKRADEALALAHSAMASAKSERDRFAAQSLAQSAVRFKQMLADHERLRQEGEQIPEGQRPQLARRSGGSVVIADVAEAAAPALEARPLKLTGKKATATGKVAQVICGPAALELVLERPNGKLRLFAQNFYKLDFMAHAEWQPPSNFQPCEHLTKLRVKVTYQQAEDADYAGEMQLVEILKP